MGLFLIACDTFGTFDDAVIADLALSALSWALIGFLLLESVAIFDEQMKSEAAVTRRSRLQSNKRSMSFDSASAGLHS